MKSTTVKLNELLVLILLFNLPLVTWFSRFVIVHNKNIHLFILRAHNPQYFSFQRYRNGCIFVKVRSISAIIKESCTPIFIWRDIQLRYNSSKKKHKRNEIDSKLWWRHFLAITLFYFVSLWYDNRVTFIVTSLWRCLKVL